MKIKVAPGANPLESLAVEDKLKSLGVSMDPTDRSVDEAGAAKSSVKGGIDGLAKAAAIGGDKQVLEPSELGGIPLGFFAGIKASTAESQAKAKLEAATQAVSGARGAIVEFMEASTFSVSSIASVFRRVIATAGKLDQATQNGVIGYSTAADRNALRAELAQYSKTIGQLWGKFADVMNQQALPFVGKRAEVYNRAGDAWGYGFEATIAAESASGTTREVLNLITRNVGTLSDVHQLLMKCASIYAGDLLAPPKQSGPRTVALHDLSGSGHKYWTSEALASAKVGGSDYALGVVLESGVSKAWLSRDGENAGVFPFTWVAGAAELPKSIAPDVRQALEKQLQGLLEQGLVIKAPS
ncbi:MAG: hypothetical protein U1E65_00450 [Myxococcota bacterium]